MARFTFKLPDIGEGIAEAEIVAWHVKVGDTVSEDQGLADMMTDKATVEMESPVAGVVVELAGEVGDQVPIGSALVVIEVEGDAAEPVAETKAEEVAEQIEAETPGPAEAESEADEAESPLPPAGGAGGGHVAQPSTEETSPPLTPPASGRG